MRHRSRVQSQSLCFCLCLSFLLLCGSAVDGAEDLASKCGQVVSTVMPCLSFARGQAAVPTKECCDATTSIRDTKPECLCFIIQQTHKGSTESKQLGIQEAKLLQLPSACKLKNANVSDCPRLLGLAPDSPDAAIFKNVSSSVSPSPAGGAATTGSNTSSPENLGSFGNTVQPPLFTDILAVALAILLLAFPTLGFLINFT